MMYKELKQTIIKWLLENENVWQRVNSCLASLAKRERNLSF